MNKIEDGGPAFPVPEEANINNQEGMTLRDWFAAECGGVAEGCSKDVGEALTGRPFPTAEIGHPRTLAQMLWWADVDATYRYMRADAMLKARATGPKEES